MFEIEYKFREEDLLHFNDEQLAKTDHFKKTRKRQMLVIPGLLILGGMFYWSYKGDMMTGIYIGGLGLLWAISSPIMIKWDLHRQVLKSYTTEEKANMFGKYKLKIEPQFLLERSPSGKHKYTWNELLRIEYGDKYVYIYVDLDTALIIPVETVTKGKLQEFSEQVEELIERHS
jgi:YcxB-like protein